MPEPSIGDFDLARSTVFTGRLQYLLCRYAKAVMSGSGSQTPTSRQLASRVQSDPGGMAGKIAVCLVSDGGISGTSNGGTPPDSTKTDPQLDGVIQSVWNSGALDGVL